MIALSQSAQITATVALGWGRLQVNYKSLAKEI